jgi:hypothetical protein
LPDLSYPAGRVGGGCTSMTDLHTERAPYPFVKGMVLAERLYHEGVKPVAGPSAAKDHSHQECTATPLRPPPAMPVIDTGGQRDRIDGGKAAK